MATDQNTAWDGHSTLLGVDRHTDPSQIKDLYVRNAVNRSFRGGINRTRPSFVSKNLKFIGDDADDNENVFKYGNIQAAHGYQRYYKGTRPYLIVAVADRILKGRMYADTIEFSTLWKGIDAQKTHSWFCQGENYLFWQNGSDNPVSWNGYDKPGQPGVPDVEEIEGGIAKDTVPIGNVMTYIHGRLVIAGEKNHIFISDHIYGSGLTPDSAALKSFVEIQQVNDIGAIATPAMLGQITGLIPIPRTPNRNGQGELLVACDAGFYAIDLSAPRNQWAISDIQQITLTGRGNASPTSIRAVNNDVWYRSADGGISSYRWDRSEVDREWGDTSLSREVDHYLSFDDAERLQYCAAGLMTNRLVVSTGLKIESSDVEGWGYHKYAEGMVVLDFDKGSTINRKGGFAWDGLWTGVRPILFIGMFVDRAKRSIVLSHDVDGCNRIYEVDDRAIDDQLNSSKVPIVSFYDTPYLFEQLSPREEVGLKKIAAVHHEVSEVAHHAEIETFIRPGYYPKWTSIGINEIGVEDECQLTDQKVGDDGCLEDLGETKEFYDVLTTGASDLRDQCQENGQMVNVGRHFSVRTRITGRATINQMQAQVNVTRDNFYSDCAKNKPTTVPVHSCQEDLFEYNIAKTVEEDGE